VVTIFRKDDTASRLRNQKVEVIDAALPDQASPSIGQGVSPIKTQQQFVIHFIFSLLAVRAARMAVKLQRSV